MERSPFNQRNSVKEIGIVSKNDDLAYDVSVKNLHAEHGREVMITGSPEIVSVETVLKIDQRSAFVIKQTACAAMPSFSPVNPRCSSVVALTLTRSSVVSKTCARLVRMAEI